MVNELNLRGTPCPLNFVKAKIYLEKLAQGDLLQVILDAGEAVESVYSSMQAEGHQVATPERQIDGSYLVSIRKVVNALLLVAFLMQFSSALAQASAISPLGTKSNKESAPFKKGGNGYEQIVTARNDAYSAPTDLIKRLQLARLLLRNGDKRHAAIEYLNATVINPRSYIAYHEMLTANPSTDQINEAIARLYKLDDVKSKQLLASTVLSELYERKDDYYQAARVLVDLQYSHNIPQKYVAQITSRIHVLLSKDKDNRTAEKATEQKTNVESAEYTPVTPVPMPDVTTADAPVNRLRNNKAIEGYGHAQLLP